MEMRIKRSVATLLAHIIKVDQRDIEKEASVFCSIMGQNFGCEKSEALEFLRASMKENYNLDEHIDIINSALKDDRLSKMHILEQLNHIIYSDTISADDYRIFEKIKKRLFPNIS
jgi:uncharacterized tellurite resistance protein B-like protein